MCVGNLLGDLWILLKNPDFWTFVGAVATVVAALGVLYAIKQIKLSGWIEAQNIFTETEFVKAREKVFGYFPFERQVPAYIDLNLKDLKDAALLVCRQMDKLARLKPYLGMKTILQAWGYPLGKAWLILEGTVRAERKYHPRKWDAFERLGEKAVKKLRVKKLNK